MLYRYSLYKQNKERLTFLIRLSFAICSSTPILQARKGKRAEEREKEKNGKGRTKKSKLNGKEKKRGKLVIKGIFDIYALGGGPGLQKFIVILGPK